MIKEFVSANAKTKAEFKLMSFKMQGSMDSHIATFKDLIELCDTPTKEAYTFFFMSLPDKYKSKFSIRFPSTYPESIDEAYEYARVVENSLLWSATKNQKDKKEGSIAKGRTSEKPAAHREVKKPYTPPTEKDHNADSWGPAQRREGRMYKANDRCCKCGKKPWSDPNHPCRKELVRVDKEQPKN